MNTFLLLIVCIIGTIILFMASHIHSDWIVYIRFAISSVIILVLFYLFVRNSEDRNIILTISLWLLSLVIILIVCDIRNGGVNHIRWTFAIIAWILNIHIYRFITNLDDWKLKICLLFLALCIPIGAVFMATNSISILKENYLLIGFSIALIIGAVFTMIENKEIEVESNINTESITTKLNTESQTTTQEIVKPTQVDEAKEMPKSESIKGDLFLGVILFISIICLAGGAGLVMASQFISATIAWIIAVGIWVVFFAVKPTQVDEAKEIPKSESINVNDTNNVIDEHNNKMGGNAVAIILGVIIVLGVMLVTEGVNISKIILPFIAILIGLAFIVIIFMGIGIVIKSIWETVCDIVGMGKYNNRNNFYFSNDIHTEEYNQLGRGIREILSNQYLAMHYLNYFTDYELGKLYVFAAQKIANIATSQGMYIQRDRNMQRIMFLATFSIGEALQCYSTYDEVFGYLLSVEFYNEVIERLANLK